MAIGVVPNSSPQPLSPNNDQNRIETTLSTLRRCLEMAGKPTTPGNRSAKNSISEDSAEGGMVEAVPESSKWPHCQHMISNDEVLRTTDENGGRCIRIVKYEDESQIKAIMRLITKDLSEPYSIYTYRYFLHNWPELCYLALDETNKQYVGAVLCKMEVDMYGRHKGYLAMLAVDESCRRIGLGTRLVRRAIDTMVDKKCDEVVLETEVSNKNAQRLYSNLGFIRQKRLIKYYLNGGDAFRLKLIFTHRKSRSVTDGKYQREDEDFDSCRADENQSI